MGAFMDIAKRRLQTLNLSPNSAGADQGLPGSESSVGSLQVAVTGAEGKVFLDGELKGMAKPGVPLVLNGVPAGEAKVSIEAPNFSPAQQAVIIEPGKRAFARLSLLGMQKIIAYRSSNYFGQGNPKSDLSMDGKIYASLHAKEHVTLSVPTGRQRSTLVCDIGRVHAQIPIELDAKQVRYVRMQITFMGGFEMVEVDEATASLEMKKNGSKPVEQLR